MPILRLSESQAALQLHHLQQLNDPCQGTVISARSKWCKNISGSADSPLAPFCET